MAESVRRRVAAARLAVAFVAAGTIAGATAWASAGPPPPQAEPSAVDVFSKHKIDSSDVKNGSLVFEDFKSGEIVSSDLFVKYKKQITDFKQDVKGDVAGIKGELGTVKLEVDGLQTEVSGIKGELGTYVKGEQADARYLKISDPVVRGDGSVFSESRLIPPFAGKRATVMDVPGLLAIEAENGTPRLAYVVNRTGGPLTHTGCGGGGGSTGNSPAGVVQPGKFFHCAVEGVPLTIQFFGEGADPLVITLTFSSLELGQTGEANYTAQIVVGT